MKKYLFASAIVAAYIAGYCDWLEPGFLKFGLPASWDKPLTTVSSYDLAEGVRETAHCAVLETVPDWMKPSNWLRDHTKEPKTCKQRLREAEEE